MSEGSAREGEVGGESEKMSSRVLVGSAEGGVHGEASAISNLGKLFRGPDVDE